jgi:RecG-like helicase
VEDYEHPERSAAVIPIYHLIPGRSATVQGRVSEVEDITKRQRTSRTITIGDDSGEIRVTFRSGQGAEIQPGQVLRVTGKARQTGNRQISMYDPTYRVIETPEQS